MRRVGIAMREGFEQGLQGALPCRRREAVGLATIQHMNGENGGGVSYCRRGTTDGHNSAHGDRPCTLGLDLSFLSQFIHLASQTYLAHYEHTHIESREQDGKSIKNGCICCIAEATTEEYPCSLFPHKLHCLKPMRRETKAMFLFSCRCFLSHITPPK